MKERVISISEKTFVQKAVLESVVSVTTGNPSESNSNLRRFCSELTVVRWTSSVSSG